MDLLKFLIVLPVSLARGAYVFLKAHLPNLIGHVSWSPPPWVPALLGDLRLRPRRYIQGALATLGALALIVGGWEWYLHRPRPPEPERITFEAVAPAVTTYEKPDGTPTVIVHPLEIRFSASAAPIERVGKTVPRGITMIPAVKGEWTWTDDRTLRFVPSLDWPVGAHVDVNFDVKQAFAPHVLMADDHCAFDVAPFRAALGTGEFYQDPQNPTAKKTIMPVTFNYPVDKVAFEKRISLALRGRDGKYATQLKFTVVYDAARLKAFVHSQPLTLPHDSDTTQLKLDAGVKSSRGGPGTDVASTTEVNVPGLYSLAINDLNPTLVNNDKYEPEQALVFTTTDAVRGEDVAAIAKAWVLPKRNPRVKQRDDDPPYEWGVSEVGEGVLRASQSVKLEIQPTEQEYAQAQSFKYHAEPGQRIFVRFAGPLKSFGGYILGHTQSDTFTVPDYPKLLHFMADGSLLSLGGDKRVSVVARNMPGMRVMIGRVEPDQLQHVASMNYGSFAKPSLGIDEDHLVERFIETRAFPPTDPGEAHYEGIDLGDYLKAGKRGVFLLHLSSYDPSKKKPAGEDTSDENAGGDGESYDGGSQVSDSRLIVVTDLGLIAKRNLDGSRDVFVQSIASGAPVGGARVSVVAVNGTLLFSEASSADGVVHFPTLKGLEHEKRPAMYLVEKEGDLSFLPIDGRDRRLDFSRFDVGGATNAKSESELSAYLFSDRGIYRPGDLFHIGIIVRSANWTHSAAGIPLQAEIADPRGITVKKIPVKVDGFGFTELAYTPSETAPTGTWTVGLYIIGKNDEETPIGNTTVSVKEFLPDSMKVDVGLSAHVADGWVKPDRLKGIVDVHNLFGTPAANRRVEASLTLNPSFPTFTAWPDYQFYDLRHAKDGYTTQLQDGKTNDAGHAEFDLDLKKYADATYRLQFLAKAYEAEGGRNVAATAQTMVSSNPWLVGFRTVDNLSYIKRGDKRSVRLVAIDPEAKSIELKGLEAQLIERRYVSVLTKQPSGVYKYESRPKEIPLSTQSLTIPFGGVDYALPTDKAGDYAVVIRSGNLKVNRIEFSVTGEANLSRSLERNAELQVKLNKEDYAPGESVEVSIRAPYEGSGLITIERDKVYAHAWFHARTTNTVQHINVPAGFEGNGYINVQYVRDPSSNEIFMSPLSYGVAPFSVNVDARRNSLAVETPALVKPGETLTFKVHTAHPGKVVVFAVDEGILQVAHYGLGDPLEFFFRKRALDVQTSQILDLILPDFKQLMALAAPGGDQGDALSRQLNPFKRKRDKPVAFWSGIVDVNGDKELQYAVPDYFHGKLRVMAISVSPALMGTFQGATTVRGDFVLSPDVPTTLAPGDEADVGVGVSNNVAGMGSNPMPVSVTLTTGAQLQVLGPRVQSLSLVPGHEGVATFHVKANALLGSAGLTFTASYAGKTASQHIDLSVRPAAAFRTQLTFAEVGSGDKRVISDLRRMYDAYSARNASVSTVPVVLSQGLTSWLVNYDNYCSEQVTSASMSRLIAARWSAVPVFSRALQPVVGSSQTNDQLLKQIDVLRSRQNAAGGFGLWSATPDSEPFVSAYAMHFLLEARERGVAVPKEVIDAGNGYLQTLAASDSASDLDELRQRAYAVYLLTRQGNVTTNELAAVQKRLQDAYPKVWKDDLAAAWLAASYALLKQDREANQLINPFQRHLERRAAGDEVFVYEGYDDPLIQDSTVLYLLAKHFPDRAKTLSPRAMENIARPLENNEFNTLSAAMTMLALDVYASANAASIEKLGIEEMRANGQVQAIGGIQNKLLQAAVFSGAAQKLRFTNGSSLPAWIVVDQAGYDREVARQPIRSGLEITRDYTDTHGKPLGAMTLGEEIDVHVKIRATGEKGVNDVVLVDLVPGGFEPVIDYTPNGLSTVSQAGTSWRMSHSDVREDRVIAYGYATPDVQEFVYRIRATAAGKFTVPASYAESMYDRRVQARAPGGAVLTVTRPR